MEVELPSITWSEHCLKRYAERVRDVCVPRAREELSLLLPEATIRVDPPPWMEPGPVARCDAWLWLDDGGNLYAPLIQKHGGGYVATTLFAKGGLGEVARQRRTAYKRNGRASRRVPKRAIQEPPRRRPGPDVDEW